MSKASCLRALRFVAPRVGSNTLTRWQLIRAAFSTQQWSIPVRQAQTSQSGSGLESAVPFRKQLKDEKNQQTLWKRVQGHEPKKEASSAKREAQSNRERWDLTVGIEVHAQLNTDRKLFSSATTSSEDSPNTNVSVFDLAFPGTQPQFQTATLIPALRAAIALQCSIQKRSKFDRKHYFYQDQPAGYQITQYYEPFATEGRLQLTESDGVPSCDLGTHASIEIGIKQIHMEQDTAKSTLQPPYGSLLDFNRVGHPLIEIVTLPQIHHPQTAAACVRTIQSMLQSVNAVTTGMELGGLRADVNVSISPKGSGVLGQRTEIKNLSSFKAIEDAIIAEQDRQIGVLESGGTIDGETRGWTLGSTETQKLRSKEGEVDYRYMPDPDVPPLLIGEDLIQHISETLPTLPIETLQSLVNDSGLTVKDAKTLMFLENGERLDYFDEVRNRLAEMHQASIAQGSKQAKPTDKIVANWIIHEISGLFSASSLPFSPSIITPSNLATLLHLMHENRITGTSAKRLLTLIFDGDERPLSVIIETEDLALKQLTQEQYREMAERLLEENVGKVVQIKEKGQTGKLKWLVGQMIREGKGNVEAKKAEEVLRELLGI